MNTRRTESKQRSNDTHINIHASRIFTHQHFSTYVRERERERELQDGEERVEWGDSRAYSFDVNLLGDGGHGGEAHNSPLRSPAPMYTRLLLLRPARTCVTDDDQQPTQPASQRQRPESLARPREGINRLIYYLESRSEFAKRGSHVHASKSTGRRARSLPSKTFNTAL